MWETLYNVGIYRSFVVFKSRLIHYFTTRFQQSNVMRNKNNYTITYVYGIREYKIQCKRNQNRPNILFITDGENDITDAVKSYMGPEMDFHGIATTPSDLGHEKLIFTMLGGNKKIFTNDNIIVL